MSTVEMSKQLSKKVVNFAGDPDITVSITHNLPPYGLPLYSYPRSSQHELNELARSCVIVPARSQQKVSTVWRSSSKPVERDPLSISGDRIAVTSRDTTNRHHHYKELIVHSRAGF